MMLFIAATDRRFGSRKGCSRQAQVVRVGGRGAELVQVLSKSGARFGRQSGGGFVVSYWRPDAGSCPKTLLMIHDALSRGLLLLR